MNNTETGILSLIKSAVTGDKVSIPADFDWKSAVEISVKHHTAVLLYYGAYNSGIEIPAPYSAALDKYALNSVQYEAKQKYEAEMVYKAFNDGKIDYLPLKGAVMKKYYPSFISSDLVLKSELWMREVTKRHASVGERGGW